jgi:hypothetical protein
MKRFSLLSITATACCWWRTRLPEVSRTKSPASTPGPAATTYAALQHLLFSKQKYGAFLAQKHRLLL